MTRIWHPGTSTLVVDDHILYQGVELDLRAQAPARDSTILADKERGAIHARYGLAGREPTDNPTRVV